MFNRREALKSAVAAIGLIVVGKPEPEQFFYETFTIKDEEHNKIQDRLGTFSPPVADPDDPKFSRVIKDMTRFKPRHRTT